MNVKLKLAAYVILVVMAFWFLRQFHHNYWSLGQPTAAPATNTAPGLTPAPKRGRTNQAAPPPAPGTGTNQSANNAAGTNTAAGSNTVEQSVAPEAPPASPAAGNSAETAASPDAGPSPDDISPPGSTVGNLVRLVGTLIVLGVLIAYDLTHYFGSRAGEYLFSDLGEATRDPEYERAEQVWVNGKPLEAIQMMREYLQKNPRAQFVALRIAEIYEKDLRNDVAASLEYEEVLRKRISAERWGWAAIHLCNIYARMGKQDKRKELLERIARDYPKTGAAKKARHILHLPEPEEEEEKAAPAAEPPEMVEEPDEAEEKVFDLDEMIAGTEQETAAPPPQAAPETPSPAQPPKSKLPPGFRKKE
jgi:TolA-binding protein